MNRHRLTDIYKDIRIEPYGCYSNLKEHFFKKQINIYSKSKSYDSGIFFKEDDLNTDLRLLINNIINNGFEEYGFHILKKYKNDNFKNITINELASLGKLAGYNYISVYKTNIESRGNIYLTYSPPLIKGEIYEPDLNYSLTPIIGSNEPACGFPCNEKFKDSDGKERYYTCGSANYPDITSPQTYSVYKIVETV